MRYVKRDPDTGKVVGHYANEQSYAKECLPDDHPDVKEFYDFKEREKDQPSLSQQLADIRSRLDKLEAKDR